MKSRIIIISLATSVLENLMLSILWLLKRQTLANISILITIIAFKIGSNYLTTFSTLKTKIAMVKI